MTCSGRLFCEEMGFPFFEIRGVFGLHLVTELKHARVTPWGLWSLWFYLCI